MRSQECLNPTPETLHRAGREILNHNIRFVGEASQQICAFFGAQIDSDALLASIDTIEVAGVAAGNHRSEATRIVTTPRHLNLDDVGAGVSARFIVQNGPASTRVRSITRIPASGFCSIMRSSTFTLQFLI